MDTELASTTIGRDDLEGANQSSVPAPVFILGLHRSGTTWLYEMLAETGNFNTLAAQQIINFEDYTSGRADPEAVRTRLQRTFEDLGLGTRGGEGVYLRPDTLEEYGFILDNYGGGFDLKRRTFPLFLKIIGVMRDGAHDSRRPLMKNPWDFANGGLIKALMPDAKFVFIHRNPFDVISSMYRMLTAMASKPDPYLAMLLTRYRRFSNHGLRMRVARWVLQGIPRMVVKVLTYSAARSANGYLRSLDTISPSDRIDIKYETLCREPSETINRILSHLGLPACQRDFSRGVAVRQGRISPAVVAERRLIMKKLATYAISTGYDLRALSSNL